MRRSSQPTRPQEIVSITCSNFDEAVDVCSPVTGSCLDSRDAVSFLDEVRLARHLSQAPVKLSTAEAAEPPVQHFEAHRSHKSVIRLDERHTCPLSNIIIFDSDARFIMPRPSEAASAP